MLFRACSKGAASHCHQTKQQQLRKYLFQQQPKLMQPLAPGSTTNCSVMGTRLLAQLQVNQVEEQTQVKGLLVYFNPVWGHQTPESAQLRQQGPASKRFVCEISLLRAMSQARQRWLFPISRLPTSSCPKDPKAYHGMISHKPEVPLLSPIISPATESITQNYCFSC